MHFGFRYFPDEMDRLVDDAISMQKLLLLIRLHSAALAYRHAVPSEVSTRAKAAANRLDRAVGPAIDHALRLSE
jgi:hypothetical protein